MTTETARLLTLPECAARGGWSTRFVRKLIARDGFGPELVRVGRTVRVREVDFERWVALGCPGRDAFRRAAGARS